MKPVYKASFLIEPRVKLEEIIGVSGEWAASRVSTNFHDFSSGISVSKNDSALDTISAEDQGKKYFGMNFARPDNDQKNARWFTSFI